MAEKLPGASSHLKSAIFRFRNPSLNPAEDGIQLMYVRHFMYCLETFIITPPSPPYDLNNVEK